MDYPPVIVKVWGDFACFTRPECKVERVSYKVMTPSAARGALEAIFWHKPLQWRIRKIEVLNEIRYFSILRNEVINKATTESGGIDMTSSKNRVQRHTLALRDVAYLIHADAHIPPGSTDADPAKYRDQLRRRLAKGQCFQRPFLGCREFAAGFSLPDGDETPIQRTEDLGITLFDIDFSTSGNRPIFFDAKLIDGVLTVPQELYEQRGATS